MRLITTYSQFELAMSDSSGVVVVLYTAPGCPHCNNFLPKFNSLSIEREATNVAFYNVNLMSGDGMAIARKNNVSHLLLGDMSVWEFCITSRARVCMPSPLFLSSRAFFRSPLLALSVRPLR